MVDSFVTPHVSRRGSPGLTPGLRICHHGVEVDEELPGETAADALGKDCIGWWVGPSSLSLQHERSESAMIRV